MRMGLLASGAAHELGTPLSTLAVILGDWKHMPVFKGDPDLRQEIGEMQTQVQRCKSIVSGILLSAGEARGESSEETTVHAFTRRRRGCVLSQRASLERVGCVKSTTVTDFELLTRSF